MIHQEKNPKNHLTIDSIKEFRELTEIKIQSKGSGLLMIGGGVPKCRLKPFEKANTH